MTTPEIVVLEPNCRRHPECYFAGKCPLCEALHAGGWNRGRGRYTRPDKRKAKP